MKRPTLIPTAATLAALALAGALAAPPAAAASFLDRAFGTPELGVSARLRGLGGAGGALGDGGLGLLDNPVSPLLSGTTGARRGGTLQLSGGLARASENRFVPLYDTFDSYVHETAIAVNDHGYGAADFGATFSDPRLGGLVLGLSSAEAYDPRYDYYDERRTTATTDQIVSERFVSTTGTLRQTGLSVSRAFPRGLAGGVGLNVYTGTFADRDALVPRANGVSGWTTGSSRTLTGVSLALGAAWRANDRLQAALAWESGPRLASRTTTTRNDSVVVGPDARGHEFRAPRVHLAGAYRPRNTLRTTFVADVVWSAWSHVTDPQDPAQALTDTWDVRFGLEHAFLRDLPGRVGFRYERSPFLSEADRAWFTFGAGWRVDRFRLDGAVEVGKRTSRQTPMWARADQAGAVGAGMDRVEDTLARATFGVEVRL